MKGRRIEVQINPENGKPVFPRVQAGDYGKDLNGVWWVAVPNWAVLGPLTEHKVEEHEDGTITVTPSIQISHHGEPGYHGHLTRGEWT